MVHLKGVGACKVVSAALKNKKTVPQKDSLFYTMVRLKGVEPLAHGLEVRCSIQLSYRRIFGAGEGNRTLAISLEG